MAETANDNYAYIIYRQSNRKTKLQHIIRRYYCLNLCFVICRKLLILFEKSNRNANFAGNNMMIYNENKDIRLNAVKNVGQLK